MQSHFTLPESYDALKVKHLVTGSESSWAMLCSNLRKNNPAVKYVKPLNLIKQDPNSKLQHLAPLGLYHDWIINIQTEEIVDPVIGLVLNPEHVPLSNPLVWVIKDTMMRVDPLIWKSPRNVELVIYQQPQKHSYDRFFSAKDNEPFLAKVVSAQPIADLNPLSPGT